MIRSRYHSEINFMLNSSVLSFSKSRLAVVGCLSAAIVSGSALAQTCEPSERDNVPSQRYVINSDGTVTDRVTALIWQRCAVGQTWTGSSCDEDRKQQVRSWFSWKDANREAERLHDTNRFKDWRLPTAQELRTLVSNKCTDPSINTEMFPGAPSWFFSTISQYSVNDQYAWRVDFKKGVTESHLKSGTSYHIRLVKGDVLATARKRNSTKSATDEELAQWDDGIHDINNPDLLLLQKPKEVTRDLPKDSRGEVDWAAALLTGAIQPRAIREGGADMVVWDQDIIFTETATMPHVRFPHKLHSMWLACENCHDEFFGTSKGQADISMESIYQGRHCGACHGRVAFSPNSCERCHSVLHEGAPTKWW